MNKWEKEVAKSLLDSEEAALAELEKQYRRALKDITEKIRVFQADIDLLDAAMEQGGMDDAAKEMLLSRKRSKVYQKQYQEALKAQVSGILDRMQSDQYTTIDGYLKECYDDAYVGELYSIAQQGTPVITPIDQAAAVKAILTDSKISNGLYSALGVNVQGLKKTITQEISRGIASGLFYRDIARNISNVSGSGYTNAKRIVVTEGNRIQNTASRNAALDAKAHGADLAKVWDSTLDGKTRPSHRAVDGEIRELDEKFSNGLDRPGDSGAPAAEVVNCRCKEIHRPRWDIDGGFAKRDNFTGEDRVFSSPKDYADFKKSYWSQENLDYMQHVSDMEKKYGTKKFETVLDKMTDAEYRKFKALEEKSPLWKKPIEKSGKSGTIKLPDITIGKSVGAKSKNYDIIDPSSGEYFNFAEGTKIQNAVVFAGSGVKKPLKEEVAEGLAKEFGGNPAKWQHAKGIGVIDHYGEEIRAEVHWFQEETVGKVKFKVKEWLE